MFGDGLLIGTVKKTGLGLLKIRTGIENFGAYFVIRALSLRVVEGLIKNMIPRDFEDEIEK